MFDVAIMWWQLKVCPTKILITHIALYHYMVAGILYMCLKLINRFEDSTATVAGLAFKTVFLNMTV